MNILLITDKPPASEHSSIDGLFQTAMQALANVWIVYFNPHKASPPAIKERIIDLPYQFKRRGLRAGLQKVIDLHCVDLVIVRNTFPVLRQILNIRKSFKFRAAFWESFPHAFRELFQARQLGHAILRKRLEYGLRKRVHQRLIGRCDLYMPITVAFKTQFRPELDLPWHPVPMGVDFSEIPAPAAPRLEDTPQLKYFVYSGAVDSLRRLDVIVAAFQTAATDFRLDIYTASCNATVEALASGEDPRIRIQPALPHAVLMARLARYNAGIGLIPDNELFRSASPTKTLEYYAMGIPAIVNRLPDYTALFDARSAFFCDFSCQSIQHTVQTIGKLSAAELRAMGAAGRQIVKAKRDYRRLAQDLHHFFIQTLGR